MASWTRGHSRPRQERVMMTVSELRIYMNKKIKLEVILERQTKADLRNLTIEGVVFRKIRYVYKAIHIFPIS